MNDSTIPEQEQGSKVDVDFSLQAASREEAIIAYRTSARRLLDVNSWDRLCGSGSATFEITDSKGVRVGAPPQEGYYFKIKIPAPGPVEGEGYDWVRVEMIERADDMGNDEEQISLQVRPASSPANDDDGTAHFFGPEATSTFQVNRKGRVVTASVHGRNETANSDTDRLTDKVRNAVVSLGARAGFSSVQWNKLVKGLIEGEPSEASLI